MHAFDGRPSRADAIMAGPIVVPATVLAIPIIGCADYLTGRDYTFSLFYLIPVAIASWRPERAAGLSVAILCALAWLAADYSAKRFVADFYANVWNFSSRLVLLSGFAVLLTMLKRALRNERRLSRTDGLTGLHNRRAFREWAEAERLRARRYRHPMSVVYMDIDGFKSVNDTHGHAAGDALLRRTAAILKGTLRATDLPARIGGDEFAILMPETDAEEAKEIAHKLQSALHQANSPGQGTVTFSMGVVTCTACHDSLDLVLDRADRLMYVAKSGKGDAVLSARC